MSEPRRIVVLAFTGRQILDVVGPSRMFAGANVEMGRTAYDLTLAAREAEPLRTNGGLTLSADQAFADVRLRARTTRSSRRALPEGGARIAQIALACGFGSAQRMDRAFARAIATTPGDFRSCFKSKGDPAWPPSTPDS